MFVHRWTWWRFSEKGQNMYHVIHLNKEHTQSYIDLQTWFWFTIFFFISRKGDQEGSVHGICNMLKMSNFLHVVYNTTVLSNYSAHERKESQIFISKKSHFLNMKVYHRVNNMVGSCNYHFKFSINVTVSMFNFFIIHF